MPKTAQEYIDKLFPNGFENWEGNLSEDDLIAAFKAGFLAGQLLMKEILQ